MEFQDDVDMLVGGLELVIYSLDDARNRTEVEIS